MAASYQAPAQVLEGLLEGNKHWTDADSTVNLSNVATRGEEFVNGQDPNVVVITCSDSRVIPEFIFDSAMGQLFVIRIAGNIISPEVLASVEFAVDKLNCSLVLVLGHQNCGAVQGRLDAEPVLSQNQHLESPNMDQLIQQIQIVSGGEDQYLESIRHNARYQSEQIPLQSKLVGDRVQAGKVEVKPALYWLESREVEILA